MNSKKLVTLFVILVTNLWAFRKPTVALPSDDRSIVDRKAYRFPSYEEALRTSGVKDYATREDYGRAVSDSEFEFQKLTYISDGLKVIAYLYKPKRVSGRKLPAIVFN